VDTILRRTRDRFVIDAKRFESCMFDAAHPTGAASTKY
jgi:hypothetical protein